MKKLNFIFNFKVVFLFLSLLVQSLIARAYTTYSFMAPEYSESEKATLVARVSDASISLSDRMGAMDTLSTLADPSLFQLFKDIAFRSTEKKLSIYAISLLGSFAGTYYLSELCDTLTDVFKSYEDSDMQYEALITLRDIAPFVPCDRNKIIDALMHILSPTTYVHDARCFFNAVPFLVNMSSKNDTQSIDLLEYLKVHHNEYQFDNLINATDAYKAFTNSITKSYFDQVNEQVAPALIDEMPDSAVTKDYITAVAFMLDSIATDSLGFAALSWLIENGKTEIGDEGKRLNHFASIAILKRPDIYQQIVPLLQQVMEKFGVYILKKPVSKTVLENSSVYAIVSSLTGEITLSKCKPGARVVIYSASGQCLFSGTASHSTFVWDGSRTISSGYFIVTIDNRPVPLQFRR